MSAPENKQEPPSQKPACSFDYKKLTPWDPCWEQYKDVMMPTACGRPICKHHWLSHIMMECQACHRQRMPAINELITKATEKLEDLKK